MAAGEMSDAEFEEFLNAFLRSALSLTTDKALFYVAVRRMRTRIRLLAQPEPMRSIVGATQ